MVPHNDKYLMEARTKINQSNDNDKYFLASLILLLLQ